MKILFFKNYVQAHTATLADGRVIQVAGYQNRRTRRTPASASGDLFGRHESERPTSPSPAPTPAPAPAPVLEPEPTPEPEPEPASPTFMSSLPPIPDVSGIGTHAQRAQNLVRRLSQAAILHDDPLTAIQSISTSRSTTFAARVDDYRQALIRHFQTAAATPAVETITAATRVPVLPPTPPVTQATQTATPLPANLPPVPDYSRSHGVHAVRAQNQVASIQRALASDDPLNAVQAIRTTRSTAFATRVDDYRTAVLAALTQQANQHTGGEAAPAPTPAPVPQPEPTPDPAPQPEPTPAPDPDQLPAPPDIVAIPNASPAQRRRAQLRVETLTAVMNARRPLLAIAAIDTLGRADPYAAQVNGYRSALHAYYTRQAAAATQTPTPAPTPTPTPAPEPTETIDSVIVRYRPDGIEEINHPLARTAWNRVTRLTMAARNNDPDAAQAAVLGVPEMPETNGYNRQVNAYRAALVNHLREINVARLNNPAPTPAASILANPMNLSEADLGFVCRPNVPLSAYIDGTRLNEGYYANRDRTGGIIPWPAPEYVEAARRYLSQDTNLQGRAREYQAGTWQPENPALRAQRQAAELEQRRIEAENMRAAAAARAARIGNMPDVFKPRNPVGANIDANFIGEDQLTAAAAFFGLPETTVEQALKNMVADYNSRFTMSMTTSSRSIEVTFRGTHGETINRIFSKKADGTFSVYHALFRAGTRQGQGNAKQLFRNSVGTYQQLGVTRINVSANIDVGGYCWAQFSYISPDQTEWEGLKYDMKHRLSLIQQGNYRVKSNNHKPNTAPQGEPSNEVGINYIADRYSPALENKIKKLLASNDPYDVWKLSDIRLGERNIGRELMIHLGWKGTIDLNNPRQMRRMVQYIAGRDALPTYIAQTETTTPTPRRRTRRAPAQTQATV